MDKQLAQHRTQEQGSRIAAATHLNYEFAMYTWEVYFSPAGGCTEAVVSALSRAKSNVLVQSYSFTSAPIWVSKSPL
jgi:hypothetical protein